MLFINYSKNQNQILKKNERKAKKTEKGGDDEPEEDEDRHAEPGVGCCSCTMLQLNG